MRWSASHCEYALKASEILTTMKTKKAFSHIKIVGEISPANIEQLFILYNLII